MNLEGEGRKKNLISRGKESRLEVRVKKTNCLKGPMPLFLWDIGNNRDVSLTAKHEEGSDPKSKDSRSVVGK